MMYRKIAVATSLLLVMFMLYLIPSNKEEIDVSQKLEYVYPNDLEVVYLLNDYDNLSRTMISVDNQNEVSKAKDLIESLTVDGKKHDVIPNGFKSLIPKDTDILNISLQEGIMKIDFSKEFLNVDKDMEVKLIEAVTYTLTSINGIDKIDLYVDGKKLEYLPNSKKKLPTLLDKEYGINKQYELSSLTDIDSYTVYYVLNYNDNVYYTPVTKYINNEGQDKIKIIIDELATSLSYESNLMSYLNTNIKLLDYEIVDNLIKLEFNNLILSDITSGVILEEVIYTIGLSLCDELNLEEVVFIVDDQEIDTFKMNS